MANITNYSYRFLDWITESIVAPKIIAKHLNAVTGVEYLPEAGPYVVVANHSSFMDHFVIGSIFRWLYGEKVYFLTKRESFDSYFSRTWHNALGAIPVDRDNMDKQTLRRIIDLLRQKKILVIYPEGTRGPGDALLPFKVGAFKIAARMQVPIIPLGLVGSHKVMPKGKKWIGHGKVSISFGAAITPALIDKKDIAAIMEESRHKIEQLALSETRPSRDIAQLRNSADYLASQTEHRIEELLAQGGERTRPQELNKMLRVISLALVDDPDHINARIQQARTFGLLALAKRLPTNIGYLFKLRAGIQEVLRAEPSSPMANYILGTFYLKGPFIFGGGRRAALSHLQRAYEGFKDQKAEDTRFSLSYATALLKNKRRGAAIQVLQDVIHAQCVPGDGRMGRRRDRAQSMLQRLVGPEVQQLKGNTP